MQDFVNCNIYRENMKGTGFSKLCIMHDDIVEEDDEIHNFTI